MSAGSSCSGFSGSPSIAILSVTQGHGSGSESVLFQLLSGWPASAEPLLVAAPRHAAILDSVCKPNITYLVLDTPRDAMLKNLPAVNRVLPSLEGCRVVHGWSSRAFEIAWWLGWRLKKPALCTLHDHPRANFITPPRQRIMRWAGNRLDGLICVSEAVRQACIAAGYHTNMRVIYNGLVDGEEHHTRENLSAPVRLGFLGMNAPLKGFPLIAQWARQTAQQPIEWHLYGSVHESLQAEVTRLCDDLPDRVILHGRQPADVIYRNIDVLVHASTEFDSFPTVLLEAARAGLPAVATDLGGSVEIVAHGETGFLFRPTQPETGLGWIQQLVNSPELRGRLGQAARRRFVAEFQVERMVAQYAEVWQELGSSGLRKQ